MTFSDCASAQRHLLRQFLPQPLAQPSSDGPLARMLGDVAASVKHDAIAAVMEGATISGFVSNFEPTAAVAGGRDYACTLLLHLPGLPTVTLGEVPYPTDDGEFVLAVRDSTSDAAPPARRYYVPLFLRTESQTARMVDLGMTCESVKRKFHAVDREGGNDRRDPADLVCVFLSDLLEATIRRRIRQRCRKLARTLGAIPRASSGVTADLIRTHLNGCLTHPARTLFNKWGQLVADDQPLSRLCQLRELSFFGPGGIHPLSVGHLELRDLHPNDRDCICPVQTPQGHAVGLRLFLARAASINVDSRRLGGPGERAAGDSLGLAASLVPFIEHDDAARALMGANMMRQAMSLVRREQPLVQTGYEQIIASLANAPAGYTDGQILALGTNLRTAYIPWGLDGFEDGIVLSSSAAEALEACDERTFWLDVASNWGADAGQTVVTRDNPHLPDGVAESLHESGCVRTGASVAPGDVLVSALRVQTGPTHKAKVLDRLLVNTIPAAVDETIDISLRMPSDYLGTVEDVVDSDVSAGAIALASGVTRRIGVRVRRRIPLAIGDKVAGRHGNKGVIGKILPDCRMPFVLSAARFCSAPECDSFSPHEHVQMILNPIGVFARLNLGQLYETALSRVAHRVGHPFVVRSFDDKWTPHRLKEQLVAHGFSADGSEQLHIATSHGSTALAQRSFVGSQYMLRLWHRAPAKVHARGHGKPWEYSVRDDQPVGGKKYNGGQRIGEMETWALAGHSAWHLLDDCLTVRSDDRRLREATATSGFGWDARRRPRALVNLILATRAMGLDLRVKGSDGRDVTHDFLHRQEGAEIDSLGIDLCCDGSTVWGTRGEVRSLRWYEPSQAGNVSTPDTAGLYSRTLFRSDADMASMVLGCAVLNPLAADAMSLIFHNELHVVAKEKGLATEKVSQSRRKRQRLTDYINVALHVATANPEWPTAPPTGCDAFTAHRFRRTVEALRADGERRPADYLLRTLAVLPPAFRKERRRGRTAAGDFQHPLNLLYLRVLTANQRLADSSLPEAELHEARRFLLSAVYQLFMGGRVRGGECAGLVDLLSGKTGLLRGHLAGKRTDYSGRAVIVGDASVPLDSVSLPEWFADAVGGGRETGTTPDIVVLNRQPSLHRMSMQAFHVQTHTDSDAIRINPYVCRGFNADFDGDTIAVHAPLKPQARIEAMKLLPSMNGLSQANNSLALGFNGDLALAAALLTYDAEINTDDAIPTGGSISDSAPSDVRQRVLAEGVVTTAGRMLFRSVLPRHIVLRNHGLSVHESSELLRSVVESGSSETRQFAQAFAGIASEALRLSGLSLSIEALSVRTSIPVDAIEPLSILAYEGMSGLKGSLQDLHGPRKPMRRSGREAKTAAIESGLLDGHTEAEYFLVCHGARAGLVDKGLNTAPAGSLLRKLIYQTQRVFITMEDCENDSGLVEAHGARSPLHCKATDSSGSPSICQRCYGIDPATGEPPALGLPVGILAAQAIGERTTQITLRTFQRTDSAGLDLETLARKLTKAPKSKTDILERLQWLTKQFELVTDAPRQVHFEVLLRALQDKRFRPEFVTRVTFGSVRDNLLFAASQRETDSLSGVISKIVTATVVGIATTL